MVEVSPTYNPYADMRYCDILAIFEMLDVNAEYAAIATASDMCALSQIRQTHDRIEQMSDKFASLEHNFWMLDGSFILPEPDNLGQTGWWSDNISGADGVFAVPPRLIFTWQENRDSAGFTICFDDKAEEFPSRFKVYAYDYTGALINQTSVENTGLRCIVDMPTENYRQIVFEFLETPKPYRRVRVVEVLFGVVQRFDRDNIISASLETAFSPNSVSLPAAEFNLTVDNSSKEWNMANPQGIYAYLQQSQPLALWLGINKEWAYMGNYFFTTATAEDNALTASITSHDKIFALGNKKYRGSVSEAWSLSQAVTAVLEYSGVGLVFSMPPDIAARMVSGAMPEDITCREALRLITQAGRCACYINRAGVLVFFDPLTNRETMGVLDFNNMAAMPKITVGEKINVVELTVRRGNEEFIYTASDIGVDEPMRIASYDNPLVLDDDGNLAAAWLLALRQRRFAYKLQERGNPARDIADWLMVHDPYGSIQTAAVIRQKLDFDGGLKGETDALGVV